MASEKPPYVWVWFNGAKWTQDAWGWWWAFGRHTNFETLSCFCFGLLPGCLNKPRKVVTVARQLGQRAIVSHLRKGLAQVLQQLGQLGQPGQHRQQLPEEPAEASQQPTRSSRRSNASHAQDARQAVRRPASKQDVAPLGVLSRGAGLSAV
jgi:hypothetical protein